MRRFWTLFMLAMPMGVLAAGFGPAPLAAAQQKAAPLEIEADDGLEWRRDEQSLVATGNVLVARGGMELRADTVGARYRASKGGDGDEVYRVDASGDVRIVSDGVRAFGDSAAYDLDQGVFVLSGGKPRLETADLKVTANRNLEYWEAKQLAVARGGAVAVSGDRKLSAEVLSAYVKEGEGGKLELQRLEAVGKVRLTSADIVATGDEAVYDAVTGVATLCGNVDITRGQNRMRGKCAEINLNTGVSRLLGGGGRIKGLLQPGE